MKYYRKTNASNKKDIMDHIYTELRYDFITQHISTIDFEAASSFFLFIVKLQYGYIYEHLMLNHKHTKYNKGYYTCINPTERT